MKKKNSQIEPSPLMTAKKTTNVNRESIEQIKIPDKIINTLISFPEPHKASSNHSVHSERCPLQYKSIDKILRRNEFNSIVLNL